MSSRWDRGRFSQGDEDPLGPLANLLDLMLVFACGLIAALIAISGQVQEHFQTQPRMVEQGIELPTLPRSGKNAGEGYESVGQVYRDPETGKLILIGE